MKKLLSTLILLLLVFTTNAQIYTFPVNNDDINLGDISINTQTGHWKWSESDVDWLSYYAVESNPSRIVFSIEKGKEPPNNSQIAEFVVNGSPITNFFMIAKDDEGYIFLICMNNQEFYMSSPKTKATDETFQNMLYSLGQTKAMLKGEKTSQSSTKKPTQTSIFKKNITTMDLIEKPFCCVQGTWESITKRELLSQLKANGFTCKDDVNERSFSLWDLESYIYELPITHCYAWYDENEKLKSYSSEYIGHKFNRTQVQKIVQMIQDDIRNMGALIEYEVKGRYMKAYYQDKEIKVDYNEIDNVNEMSCTVELEVRKDDYPVNITIKPKDFSIQELINYSFGFINSRNFDEIYRTLETNKWGAKKDDSYSHTSISCQPRNNVSKGYTFLGIPIGSYVSTFTNNQLDKMSYRATQITSSVNMNKKESEDVILKHKAAYEKVRKDLENEGAKITDIKKKKTFKEFQAIFTDKCVDVSYGNDGILGTFDVTITWK